MSLSNLFLEGVWQVVGLLGEHIYLWLAPGFSLFLPLGEIPGEIKISWEPLPQ